VAVQSQFASSLYVGSSVLSATADTSYTAPTHTVTIASAASVTIASVTLTSGSTLATVASGGFTAPPAGNIPPGWEILGATPADLTIGTTVVAVIGNNLILSAPALASGTISLTFAPPYGLKIEEVDLSGTGTTVQGNVQFYTFDGTTYHARDSIAVTAVAPANSGPQVLPFYMAIPYSNLFIPNGWSLVATSFVASQLINVTALGGSF
jgi:hypothetical protein